MYRFYLNKLISEKLKVCRGDTFVLIIGDHIIKTKTTCGKPCPPVIGKKYKKGYDLYHKIINLLIRERLEKKSWYRGYRFNFSILEKTNTSTVIKIDDFH